MERSPSLYFGTVECAWNDGAEIVRGGCDG